MPEVCIHFSNELNELNEPAKDENMLSPFTWNLKSSAGWIFCYAILRILTGPNGLYLTDLQSRCPVILGDFDCVALGSLRTSTLRPLKVAYREHV